MFTLLYTWTFECLSRLFSYSGSWLAVGQSARLLRNSISHRRLIDIYATFRGTLSHYLLQHPVVFCDEATIFSMEDNEVDIPAEPEPVPCVTEAVDLDESFFGKKAKYGKGTSLQNVQVFGIVATKGTVCVLCIVPDRTKATLLPLIRKHVSTSCVINHDDYVSS